MLPVGLGDLSAAARSLLAVPVAGRVALMRRLIIEAETAARHCRRHGRMHPRLGNGTLMAAALARPQAFRQAPGDRAWLGALGLAVAVILDHPATGIAAFRAGKRRRLDYLGANAAGGPPCPKPNRKLPPSIRSGRAFAKRPRRRCATSRFLAG